MSPPFHDEPRGPDTVRLAVDQPVRALDALRPDLRAAIVGQGLPFAWPEAARREAESLGGRVKAAETARRVDLRELPFVTIDGEDAKDFDDAVHARREPSGQWTLFVAIADVSHYVKPASALDLEARGRGTSAYFPDFVIPMLPEALSNGLCSLKPGVDRLAISCEMRFAADGEMLDYRFHEAVIHSRARLTYSGVANQLALADKQRRGTPPVPAALAGNLADLHELFGILHRRRAGLGAIEFETVETRIVLDGGGAVREIVPVERNDAHRLIEECMLCANVAAARLLRRSSLPALYRVHQTPEAEKLADLREYLRGLGLSLGGGDQPQPADYRRLLGQIHARPEREVLQTLLIRSMSQAVYQPENIGHFALGFPCYTHFTSPIRRYPDLLVHRALRCLIRAGIASTTSAKKFSPGKAYPYNASAMAELGEACSAAERRADAAGYQSVNWLKCEYLRDHVGDEFEGVVSAVTGFGLFVQLKGFHIDGLIHISMLGDDYYHHDPVQHFLEGERKGAIFRLGDSIAVQVLGVIPEEQKIELRPAGASELGAGPGRKRFGRRHAGRGGNRSKQARGRGGPSRRRYP